MAIRTVSAAGGMFTSTGTWVGGVVPVANDGIVANATSGNLSISLSDTPSLISADFTGYTGTLTFGVSRAMIFNSVGTTFLTLSSGMTISNGGLGVGFYFQRSATITSPVTEKVVQARFVASTTITLINNLTLNIWSTPNVSTTFTGANLCLKSNVALGDFSNVIMAPGSKMIVRDTSATIGNAFFPPKGHFAFDVSGTIGMVGMLKFAAKDNNTFEFMRVPTFTGNALWQNSGKPKANLNFSNPNDYSCTLLMTPPLDELQIGYIPTGTTVSNVFLNLPNGLIVENIVLSNSNAYFNSVTCSITGTGYLTASNIYIENPRTTVGATLSAITTGGVPFTSGNGIVNVSLSPTFSYTFGNVYGFGHTYQKPILRSSQAGITATISVTGSSYFTNFSIIDIANVGTAQKAYTSLGNSVTNSSGFTTTEPSGGGGGGSFTFVN